MPCTSTGPPMDTCKHACVDSPATGKAGPPRPVPGKADFVTVWRSEANKLSMSEMTRVLLESEMPGRWGVVVLGGLTRPHEWAEQQPKRVSVGSVEMSGDV